MVPTPSSLRKGISGGYGRVASALIQGARIFGLLAGGHAVSHPVRTGLTVIGVSLGVSAPIAIDFANRDVLSSFRQTVVEAAGNATLEVGGGDLGINEELIRRVREHQGVVEALPIIQRMVRDVATGRAVTLVGTDLLEVAQVKRLRWHDVDPDREGAALLEDGVILGHRLALKWGVRAGDLRSFELATGVRTLRVAGVLDAEGRPDSMWEGMAIMDIAPAQELFNSVGRLDRIDVVTHPSADVGQVRRSLLAQFPHGVSVHRPVQRGEQVESMVAAFRLNLVMLSAVGLLVGAFLIHNTLSFSVAQRRRDIGILRAIGLSERGIHGLFLSEGMVYGVLGGALGSLFGLVLAHSLVGMVGRNISELYVSLSEQPAGWPTSSQLIPLVLQGMGLGVGMSVIGAWGPSREASRTQVVRVLAPGGYELAALPHVGRGWRWGVGLLVVSAGFAGIPPPGALPVFGYLSVLGLLLGLTAMTPALVARLGDLPAVWKGRRAHRAEPMTLGRLAASAASRAPYRNGVTVSSLLVGVAITVGVIVMIRSFRHTVEFWIDQTVAADLIVTPAGWLHAGHEPGVDRLLPEDWRHRIAGVPGVAAVDTYRDLRLELAGRTRMLVARDLRLHADRSRYLFVHGDSRAVLRRAAAEQGVVMSEVLAEALGLAEGDEVVLTTPAGPRSFPVFGIFYDYATDGGKIVMDRSLFLESWGDPRTSVFPVYLDPWEDARAVGSRIETVLQNVGRGSAPISVLLNAELRQEILAIFDRTFRVTYVLEVIAVVIAMFGIVNTLLTAALERRRELGTLQALGAGPQQLVTLLLWEAGYLGVLGGLLGLVGGVWLAAVLVWVINKQSFGWTIPLSLPGDVLVIAPMLSVMTALAAAYWPARWIARQPAVEGLRYE